MGESADGEGVIAGGASEALRPQLPVVLPLLERCRQTATTQTLFFPLPERPAASLDLRSLTPGQFVMVWLPGVDEKPYAVSHLEGQRFGITVMGRGVFSSRLQGLGAGAQVGFRGPYGRGFWGWQGESDAAGIALIAGGCGMAPLALLAERLPVCTVVQGAPGADEVMFADRFPRQVILTEDGSLGRRGLPTEWLREALAAGEVRGVYTCGPEAMMVAVVAACREAGVPCQASLERYMKCGVGVCGQCECDGRLVCRDGPVFSAEELAGMPSFGRSRRLGTGQQVPLAAPCTTPPRGSEG